MPMSNQYYPSNMNGLNELLYYTAINVDTSIEHPYGEDDFKNSIIIELTGGEEGEQKEEAQDIHDDIIDTNVVNEKLKNLEEIYRGLRTNAEHQEGYTNQYTEDKAIDSLHECLNNNSTLEEIVYCFKEKINDDDLWFYHNNVVETDKGYELKGDEEHMSDNMEDILPQFLLRFINIYDKLVTFVERVENAWNNYIKNGPIGLVQLFNLASNTTSDGISYDYISAQLEIIDKMTLKECFFGQVAFHRRAYSK